MDLLRHLYHHRMPTMICNVSTLLLFRHTFTVSYWHVLFALWFTDPLPYQLICSAKLRNSQLMALLKNTFLRTRRDCSVVKSLWKRCCSGPRILLSNLSWCSTRICTKMLSNVSSLSRWSWEIDPDPEIPLLTKTCNGSAIAALHKVKWGMKSMCKFANSWTTIPIGIYYMLSVDSNQPTLFFVARTHWHLFVLIAGACWRVGRYYVLSPSLSRHPRT